MPGNSVIHRLNPLTKLLSLLLAVFLAFLHETIIIPLVLLSFFLMVHRFTRLPFSAIISRPRFLAFFTGTIIVSFILFRQEGETLFHLIPGFAPLGPAFPVTEHALGAGVLTALRFLVVVSGSALFVSTTHPNEFVHSLTKIGIPYRYAFTLGLALRYVPIFDLEANIVKDAKQSRGIDLQYAGLRGLKSNIRYTLLPLTVSALSRVESLTITMEGRAFGLYKKRTFLRQSTFGMQDLGAVLVCLGLFGMILILI
jgi:energy-coupling factor transport system permease protein